MEKSIETVYYCEDCGSSNTSSMAWINNLTHETEEYIGTRFDEESNFCNCCNAKVRLLNLIELWDRLSAIEVNEDDELEEDFLSFPAGTDKMDVWHWFDERCPNGLAIDLMGEKPKE